MTVRKISGSRVDCEWFKDATLKKASFEDHSLVVSVRFRTHEDRIAELRKLAEEVEPDL